MAPSLDDLVAEARSRVREVSATEAKEMVDAAPGSVILDVREVHEWDLGHLPGAMLIPLGYLPVKADPSSQQADPAITAHASDLIVAQCATGKRSIVAADILQKLGYTNVVSMKGGFMGWARAGYPID